MDKRTSTNGNKVLGYIAKRIAVRDANTTCPFLGYQCIKSSCDWTVYTVILCE